LRRPTNHRPMLFPPILALRSKKRYLSLPWTRTERTVLWYCLSACSGGISSNLLIPSKRSCRLRQHEEDDLYFFIPGPWKGYEV